MSLNRYEQTIFDYWEREPDERRHWQGKVASLGKGGGDSARSLERELWDYFQERSGQVKLFADLNSGGLRRVSLLNLAEYLLRVWGPPVPPKKKAG